MGEKRTRRERLRKALDRGGERQRWGKDWVERRMGKEKDGERKFEFDT